MALPFKMEWAWLAYSGAFRDSKQRTNLGTLGFFLGRFQCLLRPHGPNFPDLFLVLQRFNFSVLWTPGELPNKNELLAIDLWSGRVWRRRHALWP
jgi:hypothetical protein